MRKNAIGPGGIFALEWRRSVNRRYLTFLSLFVFISLIFIQMGIGDFEARYEEKNKFAEIEYKKIERYYSYKQMGIFGIRVIDIPSPIFAFFYHSTPFCDLEAFIDSSVRLKINNPQVGENIFSKAGGGNLDFSWFLLIICSALAVLKGFWSYKNTAFLKFLHGRASLRTIYFAIAAANCVIMALVLALLGLLIGLQFFINSISLNLGDVAFLFVFLAVTLVVLFFFFLIGALGGTFRVQHRGIVTVVLAWFLITMFIPEIMNVIFTNTVQATMKSRYKHQIQKMELLTNSERQIRAKILEVTSNNERFRLNKVLLDGYWQKEFPKIESFDAEMIKSSKENAEKFHLVSIFSPVSFYKSLSSELSSQGYNNYIRFYEETMEKRRGFVRFIFDKRFSNYKKVEPYLDNEGMVSISRGSLPKYFFPGLLLNLFYLSIIAVLGYFNLKRALLPKVDPAVSFEDNELALESGRHYAFSYSYDFAPYLNRMLNENGQKELVINGEIPFNKENHLALFLPKPEDLPGELEVGALFGPLLSSGRVAGKQFHAFKEKFSKLWPRKIRDLSLLEILSILLDFALHQDADIILINSISHRMEPKEIQRMCAPLKEAGKIIIEIYYNEILKHTCYDHYWVLSKKGPDCTVLKVS